MGRFEWTEATEDRLVEVVDAMMQTGFHRTESGPPRERWKANVGFWPAVAAGLIIHAGLTGKEGPTPAACSHRYMKALDRLTDPNGGGKRTSVEVGIACELASRDNSWLTTTEAIMGNLMTRLEMIDEHANQIHALADYDDEAIRFGEDG
jgi:hypothetical protein